MNAFGFDEGNGATPRKTSKSTASEFTVVKLSGIRYEATANFVYSPLKAV